MKSKNIGTPPFPSGNPGKGSGQAVSGAKSVSTSKGGKHPTPGKATKAGS
jgi:hypothetical protein